MPELFLFALYALFGMTSTAGGMPHSLELDTVDGHSASKTSCPSQEMNLQDRDSARLIQQDDIEAIASPNILRRRTSNFIKPSSNMRDLDYLKSG